MDTKRNSLQLDLTTALTRLQEALNAQHTDLHRDAAIQRFEFTFELSWKLMQTILQENRIEVHGVKTILREAARLNLIDNPSTWFPYLDARNRTSHTYNAEMAKQIFSEIQSFPPVVTDFLAKTKAV
jgi:nucleotidyltransferase substrate binding protein (TIGR01987 family)